MVRVKSRYLLAEIVYSDNKVHKISEPDLYVAIRTAYTESFGDYGIALVKRSLSVRYVMEDTRMILVRIRRGAETMLSNVFLTMKSLNNVPMKIVTRHVSGSIRCAQKYWIRYNNKLLGATNRSLEKKDREALHAQIMEINKTDLSEIFRRPVISHRRH